MAQLSDMFGGDAGGTLLGLPAARVEDVAGGVAVFGADCATPYASVGAYCAGGPRTMRRGASAYAGSHNRFNFDLGHEVLPGGVTAVDLGDLPVDPARPADNRDLIQQTALAVLEASAVPVVLGGDDSVPIPLLQAFGGHRDISILQIDAHIDWRDRVENEPWGLSSTMRRASEMGHVGAIVQVGARGVGSAGRAEVEAAQAYGARLVTASDVHRDGPQAALDGLPAGVPVVICFDCDALDPAIMPAVIAPTGGGLTYHQALELIRGAAAKAPIAGAALVEFQPDADVHGIGARTAGQILTSLLGVIAAQTS